MHLARAVLVAVLLAVPPASRADAATTLDSTRIDAIFSAFTDQTPGCAAAVVRDRRTIYARGFGLADLSHRVSISPDTVFEIASVSKQFTALAVLLLEADGKLNLDDSVQQHLPELAPLIPRPVTLRQILHHTGGLVGYQELLELTGVAHENVIGAQEVMRVLAVLPELNSVPGTRYSYSDTGYFLAAQVVARVSGRSLDTFLQARVFGPLGMTSTHIYNDHRRVVPHRARAYATGGNAVGWVLNESNWTMDGDAGVQSTVLDLARWGAEVTRPRVLPPAVVEALRKPGRLNDGIPLPYGMGQFVTVGGYRGLPRALHSGGWVGYRSMLMHFPTHDTSIAVLCNAANAPAGELAQKVVDEVLASALAPLPPPTAPSTDAPLATKRMLGEYLHEGGFEAARVTEDAPGTLSVRIGTRRSTFRQADDQGWQSSVGTKVRLSDDQQALQVSVAGRPIEHYRRVPTFTPTPAQIAGLRGVYRQAALGSTLTVAQVGDGVAAQFNAPGGEVEPLRWLGPDSLVGPSYVLHIERDAQRGIVALRYSREAVRGLRYERQP